MDVQITSFLSEGLGHSSHVVDLGDGSALVTDPARLPTAQIEHATRLGADAGVHRRHPHPCRLHLRQPRSGRGRCDVPGTGSRGLDPSVSGIELGVLGDTTVPDGPVATMCGKSERAMTGASVLQRAGHADVAVLRGGFTAWSATTSNIAETD